MIQLQSALETLQTLETELRKFTDIIERIEYVRNHLGLNKSRFSAEIGMKPQTYNNFIGSQGSKPNVELIFGVVNQFGVNPMWLLNGQGTIFMNGRDPMERLVGRFGGKAAAFMAVREVGEGSAPETSQESLEKLHEELRQIDPLMIQLEEQVKRLEVNQLPTLDRLMDLLKRYFRVDPVNAVAEIKELLSRIDQHLEEQ